MLASSIAPLSFSSLFYASLMHTAWAVEQAAAGNVLWVMTELQRSNGGFKKIFLTPRRKVCKASESPLDEHEDVDWQLTASEPADVPKTPL